MDFIPGIDGPSEGVPRVLSCSNSEFMRFRTLFNIECMLLNIFELLF